ncbi:MAG: translocation/assembly module TamB domain-containing protein, partial [Muribaculaceae bacterium]
SLADPQIDLALTASNFQICDSKRAARGADIYGKGFIDIDATVSGNIRLMRLNADISVLPGTNISYVMTDAGTAIQSYSTEGLVRFVNFADTTTTAVEEAVAAMAMLMQASLNIADGTTITIDLSSNGQDRVRILPEGRLNMSMLPMSDPRITGRLNINSGFARYTPPFMTEKLFNFSNGSYIAFTGDMFNPTLNIQAVDPIRANVTQAGQNSRVIEFDVSLSVTGTLNNMNVAFDLSTDDDATVANELQSMSASQRANQAMNMLLYNVYTGTGTTADSNLSGNILYSFLSSQLNSWAARTIKGVDLSFGIDQYDRTLNGSTSTTTNYTYSVSKSLFNDRFKIVVGGNYTTDANIDENFAENLIKNISFEYFLNNARTMYLRLFRHTGYESILEGEITRTGVGFVYRRKLTSLRQLFSPRTHALPLVTLPADE